MDQQKIEEVKSWLASWINQSNPLQLRNLVQALTGAPSINHRITCNLTPHIRTYTYPLTCSNYLHILRDVTQEQFVETLNDYGNHHHLHFS